MGSDSNKSGGNVQTGGGGGGLQIPAAAKKIVQNLKEIIGKNCTDAEIYAVLLECNMDADDAVHRLLSQDTFHEVKSKRERRKEVKETQESRTRNNNGASNRVGRLGTDYVAGRTGSTENNYDELGKAFLKRENGSVAPSVSSSSSYVYRATGKFLKEKPLPNSDSSNADNRRQSVGAGDTILSSVQPSSGLQPSWSGVSKGHVSMADIVKRGRPTNKGLQMSSEIPYTHQQAASSNLSHYCIKSSQISSTPDSEVHQDFYSPHPSNVPETIHESVMTSGQQGFDNEWPVIEHSAAGSGSSLFGASAVSDAEVFSNQSSLHNDRANLYGNSLSEELQVSERDVDSQNLNSNCNGSDSAASRQIGVNGSGGASDDDLLNETSSCVSHRHIHKHREGLSNGPDLPFPGHSASLSDDVPSGVSSATANLQQLNIGKEDTAKSLTEDNGAVVLPKYLQAFSANCSHLSFGTYKAGVAPTVPTTSNPSKSDLEVSAVVDGTSAMHQDIRNSGYQDDEQLDFMHDTHTPAADSRKYESQIPSQPELMKQDIPVTTHGDQYMAPSSVVPDSSDKNAQQLDSNLTFVIDPNARNLPPPSELPYSKPMPSDLLASPVQSSRIRDSSPFLAAQSVPLRYSPVLSSMNSPSISMSEVLNSSAYALPLPASQALPGANLATGNILSPHLSVHPYSEPEQSLGELTNITGYPSMPRSQTYVPSTLPQAFPNSSAFHDSLAGMNYNLSLYRSGAAMNSMHLPNGSNAGYGSFLGSSTNLPGSFLHNLSTSHTGAGAGYDDLLRSQFKDGNVISHQQNKGFSTWDLGNGSRAMSVLPESAYYGGLLGQNLQHAVYQQDQRASQHYESLGGYPRIYRSRTGIGREQQRQNHEDFMLTDSQGATSNQLNQIWGHNY